MVEAKNPTPNPEIPKDKGLDPLIYGAEFGSLPNDNKISDNKFANFSDFYYHGISQEKTVFFFHNFPSIPPPLDPLQNANFINMVVSASLGVRALNRPWA